MSVSKAPLLKLTGICVNFGFVKALKSVDLTVQHKEVVAIVGDSGAGKSTLVHVIAGFQQPDSGTICMEGAPMQFESIREAGKSGIAEVFQSQEFCDNLDITANIFLGQELHGRDGTIDNAAMDAEARRILHSFDSPIRTSTPIGSLSVGQRQMVALARTMLNDPKLIVMDEPTASLSVLQSAEALKYIKRLRSEGRSVVMVSHNLPDVFAVADTIVVLRNGRVNGVHTTQDTSYEEIIAEISGVPDDADQKIPKSNYFDGYSGAHRHLIDRTTEISPIPADRAEE